MVDLWEFFLEKTYLTMRKRYWWHGMCGNVQKFCRSCVECVSRRCPCETTWPPLMPIPVGSPFHQV